MAERSPGRGPHAPPPKPAPARKMFLGGGGCGGVGQKFPVTGSPNRVFWVWIRVAAVSGRFPPPPPSAPGDPPTVTTPPPPPTPNATPTQPSPTARDLACLTLCCEVIMLFFVFGSFVVVVLVYGTPFLFSPPFPPFFFRGNFLGKTPKTLPGSPGQNYQSPC